MRNAIWIGLALLGSAAAQQPNDQNTPPHPPRPPSRADIKYGPHAMNGMDLYLAKSDKPTPLVMYFFPGAFVVGNKNTVNPNLLDACGKAGISVASIDYRYSTQAPFPGPFLDAARALQFLRLRAKEYNINPRAIASTGASSGADISLWLGFHKDMADPSSADPLLRESTRVTSVGAASAQTTLDPRVLVKLIGPEGAGNPAFPKLYGLTRDQMDSERAYKMYEEASAATLLNKDDAVPVFLYYSMPNQPVTHDTPTGERVHHPIFGFYLKEKMDKIGVECVMHLKDDYGDNPGPLWHRDMVEFFLKHFPKE